MTTKCAVLLIAVAVLAMACTIAAPMAVGQAVYGSILGTVTDPQGAAVAGAKITVINQRKGTQDTATTNADGNYSVTHLIPDLYTVRAEGAGFKISEQKDVIVNADAGSRVDMQFQVGGTSETVEVTAEAPQLKTDRADVAVSFNEKYVEDVPILNRKFCHRARRKSSVVVTPPPRTLREASRFSRKASTSAVRLLNWMVPTTRIRSSASLS